MEPISNFSLLGIYSCRLFVVSEPVWMQFGCVLSLIFVAWGGAHCTHQEWSSSEAVFKASLLCAHFLIVTGSSSSKPVSCYQAITPTSASASGDTIFPCLPVNKINCCCSYGFSLVVCILGPAPSTQPFLRLGLTLYFLIKAFYCSHLIPVEHRL